MRLAPTHGHVRQWKSTPSLEKIRRASGLNVMPQAAAVWSRTMKGSQKPKKAGKKAPQKTMKERKTEKRAAAKHARTMDV